MFILCAAAVLPGQTSPPTVSTEKAGLVSLAARPCSPETPFTETRSLLLITLAGDVATSAVQQSADAVDGVTAHLRERDNARTDQQHGASSTAGGTTTIVDKPGIADLITLAIEQGAVTKTTSGTTFTLQTTPYLLYSHFGGNDTAQTWDSLVALRHLGLSATFTGSGDDIGGGLKNFQSAEAKYVVFGDRSSRDKVIRDDLRRQVGPELTAAIVRATGEGAAWYQHLGPGALTAFEKAIVAFNTWRDGTCAENGKLDADTVGAEVQTLLIPVRDGLTTDDRTRLAAAATALLTEETVLAAAERRISEITSAYRKDGPQLSLAYDYRRDSETVDTSVLKLLFGYESKPALSANLNATLELNNDRSTSSGVILSRVHAYNAEASLTFGPYAHNAVDLTAAGNIKRDKDAKHTAATAQAKLNLRFLRGVTIPVALTYASRTELSGRSQLRVNVGIAIQGDALIGIARSGGTKS
jgi:hypothetical protein